MTKLRASLILFIILFFGVCSIVIVMVTSPEGNDPDLTIIPDSTIIEIAINAARLVGIEMDRETLRVRKHEPLLLFPFGEWRYPIKEIRSREAAVEVDIQTKKIVRIRNEQLKREAWLIRAEEVEREKKPLKPTRQEDEIIAIAKEYSKSLGQALTPDMKLSFIGFNSARGEWGVVWRRYIEGFSFEEEGVGIDIDDLTGKLSLYNSSVTTKPVNINIEVSKERALRIASAHKAAIMPMVVSGFPYEITKIGEPTLRIVYPNFLVTPFRPLMMTRRREIAVLRKPRLVYSITFEFVADGRVEGYPELWVSLPSALTLWVDATTGKIIGGIY